MTNSAKTRPTPAFDKMIEKQCETPPRFGHPGPGSRKAARSRTDKTAQFRIPRRETNQPVTAATNPAALNPAPASDAKPGGGERNRTVDLLLAKQALSHLSYTPISDVR